MAFGGVFAALAVVIMCLGGLIPIATFLCPITCMLLLSAVLKRCGYRVAWAWYGAVAILSLLLGPDKEAGAVFVALGYYPVIKPKLDTLRLKWLWKALLFNAVILVLYWLLLNIFGIAQIVEEFEEMGTVMTLVTLALGNVTFFLTDRLLSIGIRMRRQHG